MLNCLDSPELPFLQWQECFSVLVTRLPKNLKYEVTKNILVFLPELMLLKILNTYISSIV